MKRSIAHVVDIEWQESTKSMNYDPILAVYDTDYLSNLPVEISRCIAAYLTVVDQLMLSLANKHHLIITGIVPWVPKWMPEVLKVLGHTKEEHSMKFPECISFGKKHIWVQAAEEGYLSTGAGTVFLTYLISGWPLEKQFYDNIKNLKNTFIYYAVVSFGSVAAFVDSHVSSMVMERYHDNTLKEVALIEALRHGNLEFVIFLLNDVDCAWKHEHLRHAIYSKDLNTVLFAVAQESYMQTYKRKLKTVGIKYCNHHTRVIELVTCILGPLEISRVICCGFVLEAAASCGSIEIFQHLYDFGYRSDKGYFSLLSAIIDSGSVAFVKYFVAMFPNDDILMRLTRGHEITSRMFNFRYADVNELFKRAILYGQIDMLELVLSIYREYLIINKEFIQCLDVHKKKNLTAVFEWLHINHYILPDNEKGGEEDEISDDLD
jgi:hypothetical protein